MSKLLGFFISSIIVVVAGVRIFFCLNKDIFAQKLSQAPPPFCIRIL